MTLEEKKECEEWRLMVYLGLDKVTDADLGHDWDGDGVDDLTDHFGVGHASNTTCKLEKEKGKRVLMSQSILIRYLCLKLFRNRTGDLLCKSRTRNDPLLLL